MKNGCFAITLALFSLSAWSAQRIDIASFSGVRNNQLVGYGLVVGLDGSGDKASSNPFTSQSMSNMLTQLGRCQLEPRSTRKTSLP